ncbi:Peptidoglycan/xylan/chitin deacetylase, PgdA/CDA1 family [Pilibacter termitis]|uniref:Peptidoglycan/xylan/chitin deacetylase, PgdA/CDA1 family n=1 Tax=Pilibacter termitis TaxID=263852 RepID=A0A1T4PWT7_9ENTE|nr:polysaccharide deacetylase family protein [Pilibacter termitis]SJZ95826.1 Peptidoglycan/xylan/chitin deacetylase, PgdA/CDA1 family [Pilibacter termitis]
MKLRTKILMSVAIIAALSVGVTAGFMMKSNEDLHVQASLEDKVRSKVVEGVEEHSILENEEYHIVVDYPKTDNETINQDLKTFAESNINVFKAKANQIDDKKKKNSEFLMSFDTTKAGNLLGFRYEMITQLASSKNQSTEMETRTYNLTSGKIVTIADVFQEQDGLKLVSEYLYKKLEANAEDKEALKKGLTPDVQNYQRFLLDEENLTLFFTPQQFDNKNASIKEYKIPLAVMTSILKPEFVTEKAKQMATSTTEEKIQSTEMTVSKDQSLVGKKLVALTYDDGPSPTSTPALLAYLKEQNIPATFFVLGSEASKYPDIVKQAYDNGNQIASHTYHHLNLPTLSADKQKEEIHNTEEVIEKIIGKRPNLMRPPYGAFNEQIATEANCGIALWNVDSLDWQSKNPTAIYNTITANTFDGSIILMHDIYMTSVEGTKQVVPALKAQGYTFVTLNQLIGARSEYKAGQAYYLVTPDGKLR